MVTTRRQNGVSIMSKTGNAAATTKKTNIPGTSKLKLEPVLKSSVVERRSQIADAPGLGTHVIFLFVGPTLELITIHSDLLADATRTYIEERNVGGQIYQLPDEDVDIFKTYRLFLYTGRVYSISENDQDAPDNGRSIVHGDKEWVRLAHGYIFATALRDENFANAFIDAIIEKITIADRYPTGIATDVYAYMAAGNPIHTLLVHLHVWKGKGTWIKPPHDDTNAPAEFLHDVIQGLATAGESIYEEDAVMAWEAKPCAYHHVHETTARCCR